MSLAHSGYSLQSVSFSSLISLSLLRGMEGASRAENGLSQALKMSPIQKSKSPIPQAWAVGPSRTGVIQQRLFFHLGEAGEGGEGGEGLGAKPANQSSTSTASQKPAKIIKPAKTLPPLCRQVH